MYTTIRGYRITFTVDTHRDILIVPFSGIETEAQACTVAITAARHGYPDGPITITRIDTGTWCPTGCWANPEHSAIYAD